MPLPGWRRDAQSVRRKPFRFRCWVCRQPSGRASGPRTPAIRVPAGRDEPAARLGRSAATRPAGRGGDRAAVRRLREELATRRKFVPAARNYAAARLEADVGLRVNEIRMLDLDVRWKLGRFGKLNVRHGKGARRCGPSRGWCR